MENVRYEIVSLEPGRVLHRKAQVAAYFYHVMDGEITADDGTNDPVVARLRDTVIVGGLVGHRVANRTRRTASVLVGAEPHEYLAWMRVPAEVRCIRASDRHPLQPRLQLTMDLVIEEISDPASGDQLTLERLAELIVFYSIRMTGPDSVPLDAFPWNDHKLMTAVSAMTADPSRDWTVDQLAGLVHMSRSAFAARFKRYLGESPIRTLTRIRLKAAAARLLQGTPIPEAAGHCGYGSEAAFNRAFGREFGVTPGRWKRSQTVD
jgi:AraC-like DNA-binding protein